MTSESNHVDKADLDRFIKAVEAQLTFNLPMVADQLELPWQDVKRQMLHNKSFREALQNVYERFKYKIMENIARESSGEGTGAKLPPVGMVKLVFDIIDEEVVLGRKPGDNKEEKVGVVDESALRARLGLGESDE